MASKQPATELDILAEVIAPGDGDLSPELAESVLQWKFSKRAIARMNKLAERNSRGVITLPERQELERYLRVGNLISILKAKARLALKTADAAGP